MPLLWKKMNGYSGSAKGHCAAGDGSVQDQNAVPLLMYSLHTLQHFLKILGSWVQFQQKIIAFSQLKELENFCWLSVLCFLFQKDMLCCQWLLKGFCVLPQRGVRFSFEEQPASCSLTLVRAVQLWVFCAWTGDSTEGEAVPLLPKSSYAQGFEVNTLVSGAPLGSLMTTKTDPCPASSSRRTSQVHLAQAWKLQ